MSVYRIAVTRKVYGYIEVIATSEEEAQAKLDDFDIYDEVENKSDDFEYGEWENRGEETQKCTQ